MAAELFCISLVNGSIKRDFPPFQFPVHEDATYCKQIFQFAPPLFKKEATRLLTSIILSLKDNASQVVYDFSPSPSIPLTGLSSSCLSKMTTTKHSQRGSNLIPSISEPQIYLLNYFKTKWDLYHPIYKGIEKKLCVFKYLLMCHISLLLKPR